jgi:hypothetical protein
MADITLNAFSVLKSFPILAGFTSNARSKKDLRLRSRRDGAIPLFGRPAPAEVGKNYRVSRPLAATDWKDRNRRSVDPAAAGSAVR